MQYGRKYTAILHLISTYREIVVEKKKKLGLMFDFLCQSVGTKQCREKPHKRCEAISEEDNGTTAAANQIITFQIKINKR